ncbi:hypothetical protein CCP2SC5_920003 [Azospirillaceae bacterium]
MADGPSENPYSGARDLSSLCPTAETRQGRQDWYVAVLLGGGYREKISFMNRQSSGTIEKLWVSTSSLIFSRIRGKWSSPRKYSGTPATTGLKASPELRDGTPIS